MLASSPASGTSPARTVLGKVLVTLDAIKHFTLCQTDSILGTLMNFAQIADKEKVNAVTIHTLHRSVAAQHCAGDGKISCQSAA